MIVEMAPEVFTADSVGEPGHRTFYLQARDSERVMTFLLEKDQVAVLAERLRELLMLVDPADTIAAAPPARDPVLQLVEPLEPEARIGSLGIGYVEEGETVLVAAEPAAEDEGDENETEYRFVLRRDQARALVLHALAVVGEGRPICPLCGLPMDPGGHLCPASNGHHPGA